jgi:hypothetical protein
MNEHILRPTSFYLIFTRLVDCGAAGLAGAG